MKREAAPGTGDTLPAVCPAPPPRWGLRGGQGGFAGAGVGSADEELSPGMLLADLVAGDGPGMSRPLALGKRRPKKAVVEATAEEADAAPWSGDEDEATASASGARLLAAMQKLAPGREDGTDASWRRRRAAKAGPESEFHAGAAGEEVAVEDLLAPLAEQPTFSDVRQQLEALARREKLPETLSDVQQSREDRSAHYKNTAKEQGKWVKQVQRMRKSDQVVLGQVQNPQEVQSISNLVGAFRPNDDFEREFDEITKAAGSTELELKGAKMLPMNPRIRDTKQIQQIAKLKALMLREQQTSKRVKKIKSKTYRRMHRKAEQRDKEVLLERLEQDNPEMAQALKQEYEKKRVHLRLQLHRAARRKWTATMQRFAKGDKGAQLEISKQAQAAHDERMALRRAIRGKDPAQSDDSDAVDFSGSDAEGEAGSTKKGGLARQTVAKAKQLTIRELRGLEKGGELPTTGILGMGFMREAIKRKRELARQEAQSVLQELEGLDRRLDAKDAADEEEDEDSDAGGQKDVEVDPNAVPKRREFSAEELAAARLQVDVILEQEGGLQCGVSGPLTVRGVAAVSELEAGEAAAVSRGASGVAGDSTPSATAGPPRPGRQRKKVTGKGTVPAPAPPVAVGPPNPWLEAFLPTPEDPAAAPEATGAAAAPGAVSGTAPAGNAAEVPGNTSKDKKKAKRKRKIPADAQEAIATADAAAQEREAMAEIKDMLTPLNGDSETARQQRDLVRTAFIEGTQLEDFDFEEEERQRKKEEAGEKVDQVLAGWGSWTGVGIVPRSQGKGKGKGKGSSARKAAEKDIAARKPGEQRPARVQIHEGKTEAGKYFLHKVPYPYENAKHYDHQLKMPIGQEWNIMPTHLHRIKPKIFVKVGAIVPPLQYVKYLPEEQRQGVIDTWAAHKQPKRLKANL